ncbi:MAG TPA: ECF transporter S component [Clostridiaceae bacterium]|nr:ECF transporter S component [Clostridiaceae bacterium]
MSNKSVKANSIRRRVIYFVVIFALIPFTISLSIRFADRRAYLTSFFIIIYALIMFISNFERKKPQARELMVLAVMSALAVASRAAFIWLPHFKPMCGIIIITGFALGASSGFLCGAVSAFVSNFIFGQGLWTPWQMFAYGLAGFISGILYNKHWLKKNKYFLSTYGAVLVILLVGPILDTCALFTLSSIVNREAALAIYASGLPVNLIHALATFFTILLAAEPLISKLERLKEKYGLMEAVN